MDGGAVVGPHPLPEPVRGAAAALEPAAAAHWEAVTGTLHTDDPAGSQAEHQGTPADMMTCILTYTAGSLRHHSEYPEVKAID